jgi:hypothetical protein
MWVAATDFDKDWHTVTSGGNVSKLAEVVLEGLKQEAREAAART